MAEDIKGAETPESIEAAEGGAADEAAGVAGSDDGGAIDEGFGREPGGSPADRPVTLPEAPTGLADPAADVDYEATEWVDGETPLSAKNMNNIETGVANVAKATNTNSDAIRACRDSLSQTVARGSAARAASVYCDTSYDQRVMVSVTDTEGRTYTLVVSDAYIGLYNYGSSSWVWRKTMA